MKPNFQAGQLICDMIQVTESIGIRASSLLVTCLPSCQCDAIEVHASNLVCRLGLRFSDVSDYFTVVKLELQLLSTTLRAELSYCSGCEGSRILLILLLDMQNHGVHTAILLSMRR